MLFFMLEILVGEIYNMKVNFSPEPELRRKIYYLKAISLYQFDSLLSRADMISALSPLFVYKFPQKEEQAEQIRFFHHVLKRLSALRDH